MLAFLRFLDNLIARSPMAARCGLVVLVTVLISWFDVATPPYVFVTGYYFLPIFLAGWYCGPTLTLLITSSTVIVSFYTTSQLMPGEMPPWEEALSYSSVLIVFVSFALLIHYLRMTFSQLHAESRTDALTGLRSRRGFLEAAELEIARASRYGHAFTVALIDIDNFKHVNDTQGHPIGDALLVAVSRFMTSTLREIDLIARLGGDEFAVMLPGGDEDAVRTILLRLLEGLRPLLSSFSHRVTASIGAVIVPSDASLSIEKTLSKADTLMYSVKHGTKDGLAVERLCP